MPITSDFKSAEQQRRASLKAVKSGAGQPPSAGFIQRKRARELSDEVFAQEMGLNLKYRDIRW